MNEPYSIVIRYSFPVSIYALLWVIHISVSPDSRNPITIDIKDNSNICKDIDEK